MQLLSSAFYEQDTITVAKELLGKYIIHETSGGITAGKIVETEAYISNDPANHASKGKAKRNLPMFGPAGSVYIYAIYGMYHCFNVVTHSEGIGEAVLLRALEPVEGLPLMSSRRGITEVKMLCKGPSRLVIAMGITKEFNGHNLRLPPLQIMQDLQPERPQKIITTSRIGISVAQEKPLRFYLENNQFISKK
jgi:DNA-3-methyladenine glycosylase